MSAKTTIGDATGSPVQNGALAGFRRVAISSFVLAVTATVLAWINTYAIPLTARTAAAAGDYASFYVFAFATTGVVVVLNVIALWFGIIAARRRSRLLLAGGGIALSAAGLIGVALTLFVSLTFPQFIA